MRNVGNNKKQVKDTESGNVLVRLEHGTNLREDRTIGVSGVEARDVPEAEAALMFERCRRAREWPPCPSRLRPLRPRCLLDELDGWAIVHGSTDDCADKVGK